MVRDVMHREFVGVSESDALADAAALMLREGTDCLVVLRGREPTGRLSARDALAAVLESDPQAMTVGDVMTPPTPTIGAGVDLAAAADRFVTEGADRLIVTDDAEAVGVITERDVLAAQRGPMGGDGGDVTNDADREAIQSVCEACGSLSGELERSNGRLLCPDCRDL